MEDLFVAWQRASPRSNFQLGLFDRRTGKLCGCAGLRGVGAEEAVFGIELAPSEWGRFALALDATAALLAFGFAALELSRVAGSTASGNRRVERLARRFGAEAIARHEGPVWMRARVARSRLAARPGRVGEGSADMVARRAAASAPNPKPTRR